MTMKNIYEKMYNCECRIIAKQDLINNMEEVKRVIDSADIIYEGGGNTLDMIKL